LEGEGALADAGLAAEQDGGARDETAAEDAVEFREVRREASARFGGDLAERDRAVRGIGTAER
jgi:hypothetical protein